MPITVDPDRPGASIEVTTMTGEGEVIGSMAIVTRDHINTATMTSWFMTDYRFVPPGKAINRYILQGNLLTMQRNEAVQRMEGDWLFFIDDDMVWETNAVARIVATRDEFDLDIVGGLCYRRGQPHQPTLFMRESPTAGAYNFLEDWPDDEIVEVDATGMAFVLIHKRVFEAIAGSPMPPPADRLARGLPNFFRWDGQLGEDLRFCQDAKAAGCKIFVHTGIEIGHIGERTIRRKEFLQELALRPQESVEVRKAVNDKMGLPTMSREEARRRLGW